MSVAAPVVTLLHMTALPGRRDELVSTFIDADVLKRAAGQPGFLGGELLVSEDPLAPVVVIARWRDQEAYAGWRASSVRDEVSTGFVDAIESETSDVYIVTDGI